MSSKFRFAAMAGEAEHAPQADAPANSNSNKVNELQDRNADPKQVGIAM